ncbi:prolyl oligopeptidase family serine peptidase [Bacillus sp. B15-48]|uniref:alpha/beta hydrolase family protein n=1 Tax=Bacillus sp. B15-48 TaxID=1548601 RepID=UPI00193FED46|nr:prolyl oligopeptidase family serine peptidase [Bacillus sp. B15-48]MBM4764525.1 prolyl oligopeptidase family serine peptidase [Bacillus sp. B15-48]
MTKVPEELAQMLIQKTVISEAPIEKRYAIYLYCRQQGNWLQYATEFQSIMDAPKLHKFCPIKNVTSEYPATLLLHGDDDEDVPYEESVEMKRKLDSNGVYNKLITIPGGKHSFDQNMEIPIVNDAFKEVIEFLKRKL